MPLKLRISITVPMYRSVHFNVLVILYRHMYSYHQKTLWCIIACNTFILDLVYFLFAVSVYKLLNISIN